MRSVTNLDLAFRTCLEIAEGVLAGREPDPTGGADHYHRDDIRPAWAKGQAPICTIGRHLFYKLGLDGRAGGRERRRRCRAVTGC